MDRQEAEERWTEDEDLEELEPSPFRGITHRRALITLGVLTTLVLMAVVPPLINVGRYRRQIATSIGTSLGRPVHIDNVTLNLLPMPGFTLEGFVVDEDPAFGAEPVIRAQEVRATLRVNSLWRRRVEFSRISLDDPSVNLVHLPNGQWNLQSILLQASRMPAAPTQQKGAGDAPRFPYIEATGARVNVKMGLEKMPLSLTDAEFALWLPEQKQWHLRLKAHPTRTDAAATNSGTLRVEGTLGQAATLANVPVDLTGEWSAAPLGAVSRVLMGNDAGLRGEMTLTAGVKGTVGENEVRTRLELRRVRRADFVPAHPLDADLACTATATQLFHALGKLKCALPAESAGTPPAGGLVVTGDVADVFRPASADLSAVVSDVPVATLLDVLRAISDRISPEVTATGTVSATAECCVTEAAVPLKKGAVTPGPLSGDFQVAKAKLSVGAGAPFVSEDVTGEMTGSQVVLGPVEVALGGREPATLEVRADAAGYSMHLAGAVLRSRLTELVKAVPPFGDGLDAALPPVDASEAGTAASAEVPMRLDLTAKRTWGGTQTWEQAATVKVTKGSKRRR